MDVGGSITRCREIDDGSRDEGRCTAEIPVFISDGVNKDRYNTVEVSGLRYWDACAETRGDKMLTLIGARILRVQCHGMDGRLLKPPVGW